MRECPPQFCPECELVVAGSQVELIGTRRFHRVVYRSGPDDLHPVQALGLLTRRLLSPEEVDA